MKYKRPSSPITGKTVSPNLLKIWFLIACLSCVSYLSKAQTADTNKLVIPTVRDSSNRVGEFLTLKQCIDYALIHQPGVNIALTNIDVAKTTNAINLSNLLPQISANGTFTHYLQQSGSVNGVSTGSDSTTSSTFTTINNTFIPQLVVSQNIFNPSLLYAAKSAPLYTKQAEQVTDSTKIAVVDNVSKSFYSLLNTLEQINVLKEDTARLGRNVRDTYHQYVGGIVDETDYEEATITLNNSMATLKQANENVVPEYASLKQLMGYPPEKQFNVNFDTTTMMQDILIDTTEKLQYQKRIELQALNTQKSLQTELVNYYRYSFLPTVSAFYNYDLNFESNKISQLFDRSYPSQLIGVSLSVPIFTGFYRLNNLKRARLQERILDYSTLDLKSQIYTEYTTALANYKGNLYNLQLLKKNVGLARRTYFVVTLQYKQGLVAYLNVITAESNLISSEISYLNALFTVLSNKVDLQKAMGNITF